jgi:hypothetical protein
MRNKVGFYCEWRKLCQCVLASYWTAVFDSFFLPLALLIPIGWRNLQIVRQRQKKMTNAEPSTFSQALASSNQVLSRVNYTPHMVSIG